MEAVVAQLERALADARAAMGVSTPAVKKPKKRRPRRLPVFLTDDEASALLAAVPTARDRLICTIGLFAGLRVSEICQLRAEHVDLAAGSLFVSQGKGDKDRYVPIHPTLSAALGEWLEDRPGGYLFVSDRAGAGHLTTRSVQKMIKAAAAKAGLAKKITPHKLRHTAATNLRESGADLLDIKDFLGHENVATTQIYAHVSTSRLRTVVDRL